MSAVTKHFSEQLRALGACKAAVEWAEGVPDAATAWRNCPYADWMEWVVLQVTDYGDFPEDVLRRWMAPVIDAARFADDEELVMSHIRRHLPDPPTEAMIESAIRGYQRRRR